MSESTSDHKRISVAEFHQAPGVADWRVTAAGPEAVFMAESLAHAAGLVGAIVEAAEGLGIRPDIDVRPEAIAVRIPHGGEDGVPAAAPEFAATVSRAAGEVDLRPDPSRAQSMSIYVAQNSEIDARPFFMAALGYDPLWDTDAVDPLRRGPSLAFNPIAGDVPSRGRRTSTSTCRPIKLAQGWMQRVAAGGRLVDDSYAPKWWTSRRPTTTASTSPRRPIWADYCSACSDPVTRSPARPVTCVDNAEPVAFGVFHDDVIRVGGPLVPVHPVRAESLKTLDFCAWSSAYRSR